MYLKSLKLTNYRKFSTAQTIFRLFGKNQQRREGI